MRRKRELMADIMARHGHLITEAGKRRMGRALKLKQQQIVAARGEEPDA